MTISTFFQKLPTINDGSKFIVQLGSGPILTALVNQNQENASLIVANSIVPQLFWTYIAPLTIEKLFMSQQNVWQAHVVGIASGWVLTYLFVKNFEIKNLPDPRGKKKQEETRTKITSFTEILLNNLTTPGTGFTQILALVFKSEEHKIAFRATIIPCLIAAVPHVYRLCQAQFKR